MNNEEKPNNKSILEDTRAGEWEKDNSRVQERESDGTSSASFFFTLFDWNENNSIKGERKIMESLWEIAGG